jgi:hypothetical protein
VARFTTHVGNSRQTYRVKQELHGGNNGSGGFDHPVRYSANGISLLLSAIAQPPAGCTPKRVRSG